MRAYKGLSRSVLSLLLVLVMALSMLTTALAVSPQENPPLPNEPPVIDTSSDIARVLDEAHDETIIIEDEEVPLAPGVNQGGWALLNLLFSIAGAVLALVMSFRVMTKKYTDVADEDEKGGRNKMLLTLSTPLLAATGIALFILTQDTGARMIMVDGLTAAHAMIFVCAVLSSILVIRNESDEDSDFFTGRA